MASSQHEDRRRAEKARQVGLFRSFLFQDLLDNTLTTVNAVVWHGGWQTRNTRTRSAGG